MHPKMAASPLFCAFANKRDAAASQIKKKFPVEEGNNNKIYSNKKKKNRSNLFQDLGLDRRDSTQKAEKLFWREA